MSCHSKAMVGLMRTMAIVVIKTGTMDSCHSGVSTTGSLVVIAIFDYHGWSLGEMEGAMDMDGIAFIPLHRCL